MSNKNDSSSIFWAGVVVAGIMYFITDSLSLSVIVGLAIVFITWILKGVSKNGQEASEDVMQAETVREYTFDFDALSPTYKSQLLKQQFGYFLKYRTIGNGDIEFYCAEDELDGYRFAFWVEYLVEHSTSDKIVKVSEGDLVCNVYIYSNKGRDYGCEKFAINAPTGGVITKFLKGSLRKGLVLFRIKNEGEIEEVAEERKVVVVEEIPEIESTVLFEDVIADLSIENENIEVEKLDDVLRWEMPEVDDIEMPDEEEDNSAYDNSVTYHATITNLSDFDWRNFKAV